MARDRNGNKAQSPNFKSILSGKRDFNVPILSTIPLQVTLVVIMVVMVLIGLMLSSVALTSVMRGYLISRDDENLERNLSTWASPEAWAHRSFPDHPPNPGSFQNLPSPFYVRYTDCHGLIRVDSALDWGLDMPDVSKVNPDGRPHTVQSIDDGGEQWRVIGKVNDSGEAWIGVSMQSLQDTINRMLILQNRIGIIVLIVVGGLGWILIRFNLTRLRAVGDTAERIATGEWGLRVPWAPINTEVGKLAASLNSMMGQIQAAFKRIEKSEEQARAAAVQLRDFLGDASHELRTPITSILGFAQLYRQGAVQDPDWVMQRIEIESERMKDLVEDILTLARMGQRRQLSLTEIDMLLIVQDVVYSAKAIQSGRIFDIVTTGGPGLPIVVGDAALIRQALSNYVMNACRYSDISTKITIEIGTMDQWMIVTVIDQGPGIEPGDIRKIFDRFYRTDASRARESGGSGLGLPIVQTIVEAHGGSVGVDSTLGEGSRFYFRLPRLEIGEIGEDDFPEDDAEDAAIDREQ